jgi:hypothetical protein
VPRARHTYAKSAIYKMSRNRGPFSTLTANNPIISGQTQPGHTYSRMPFECCQKLHFYSKSFRSHITVSSTTAHPPQQQLKLISGLCAFEIGFTVLLHYCPGDAIAKAVCGGSLVQILRCHAPVTKLTKGRTNVISSDHYDRCFFNDSCR